MRSVLFLSLSMLVVSLGGVSVGCSAPSVGDYDLGKRDLPDRGGDGDDDDDDDSTSKTGKGNGTGAGNGTGTGTGSTTSPATATKQTLTVASTGDGAGDVTSEPSGVSCTDGACKGDFAAGTKVTLTAAAKPGSVFVGWTGGGCAAGAATCTTTLTTASTLTAQFITLAGTWTGTFLHQQTSQGCAFKNQGNLENTMAGADASFTSAAAMTGFELRQIPGCGLVGGLREGNAGPSAVTISGNVVKGTWNVAISGTSGSLPLPFEATIVGKKMSGKWTCTGCTGTFDISKQ